MMARLANLAETKKECPEWEEEGVCYHKSKGENSLPKRRWLIVSVIDKD